jgi:protein TonB
MSSKINIEYKGKGCVPQDILLRYLNGGLSGSEMNSVERHLSGCPMCADEMEGLGLLDNPESIIAISEKLNDRVDRSVSGVEKGFWHSTPFRIAASVTLLIALSGLIYLTSTLNTPSTILSEHIDTIANEASQERLFEEEKMVEDSIRNAVNEVMGEDLDRVAKQIGEMPMKSAQQKSRAVAPPPPKPLAKVNIVNDEIFIEDSEVKEDMALFESEFREDIAVKIIDFANNEEEIDEEEIFVIVEEMPTFRGGDINKFREYINEHLKYPEAAAESGVQGRVILSFVVEPTGKVSNVKVLRGVDPHLDKEAVRVIESSPEWNPGKQRGKPGRVSFNIPVIFVLN